MNKAIYYLSLAGILWLSANNAFGQEQFEKRFNITFDHTSFYDALKMLIRTQTNRTILRGAPEIFKACPPVTMKLNQVTLDEAMDRLLSAQVLFKDYVLTSSKSHDVLELKKTKVNARYFNRDKDPSGFYHIGQELPDVPYTPENNPDPIRLSDYRGKLLILDIWGVHCAGCIEAMPKLEMLQRQFPDQIKILLVTKSSKDEIKLLRENSITFRNNKLPIISGENNLASLFIGTSLPKQVWIDAAGKIKYITGNDICNEDVIKDFLSGKYLRIYETRDTVFATDAPMAQVLNPINHGNFEISTYLGKHDESSYSYSSGGTLPNDDDTTKWLRTQRATMSDLYKMAYGIRDLETFSDSRIIKDYRNADQYNVDPLTGDPMFDFELIDKNKKSTLKQFLHLMQQQLDVGFHLSSSWEKRMVPCFIIKKTGKTDQLKSKLKASDIDLRENIMAVSNEALATVLWFIQRKNLDAGTLIDETGLDASQKIDCVININFQDRLAEINRMLSPYGLSMVKEDRLLDCIVLEDPKL